MSSTLTDPAPAPPVDAAPGCGAVEAGPDGSLVQGWALADSADPADLPEVALDIAGVGIRVVTADLRPPPGSTLPAAARLFAWRRPPGLLPGAECLIRAWHLGEGRELPGSPLRLPAGEAVGARDDAAPLLLWPTGLAGHVGASATTELAEGLWAGAQPPALSLRFDLLTEGPATAAAPPARGIRLLADQRSARIGLHMRPPFPLPPPGETRMLGITAWLPQATGPAMQAQAEIWLVRREAAGIVPLRRLRRVRLFRRPARVEAELTLLEDDLAPGGELCLSLQVLDAQGLAALPPSLDEPAPAMARMEDAGLASAFEALREQIRLHGRATEADQPLLPAAAAAAAAGLPAAAAGPAHPFTQVVVPVYNGDVVVRDCLRALRAAATGPMQVIVVDDGSRAHTAGMLRAEAAGDPRFVLHRRDINRGYTKSINEGVLLSGAPWVVILNSDTVVPHGWLDRLHAAARARPGTGMVGPLSNAATWQSIPAAKRSDGSWSTNDMIEPRHLPRVQALLAGASERAYPEFPALNGFCTLIAREVFDRVGLYDEDAFPTGYGEETDLCLRARRAGFRLTVADDCFVYHHKSVSFGAGRARLTRQGGLELTNKHLGANIAALEQAMQACPPMVRLRARMADLLAELD